MRLFAAVHLCHSSWLPELLSCGLLLDVTSEPATSWVPCSGDMREAEFAMCRRDFAEVLDCVSGPQARVAAVTSLERANAVNEKERPGFFDKVHQVL